MRLAAFDGFPPDEQKRVAVQKAVNQWRREDWTGPAPRVYCLSNYTLNGLELFLSYHLLKQKLRPEITFSDFNVVAQTLLDEDSSLHRSKPDFVVLSLDLRILIKDFLANTWDEARETEALTQLLDLARARIKAPVLLTDFTLPLLPDSRGAPSLEAKVRALNAALAAYVREHSSQFFLVEVNRLVSLLGVSEVHDSKLWHSSKAPYKSPMWSWLAREMATIIAAHYGRAKKCVILDCDNTLWGGVIGEDGLDGIALDASKFPGVAYHQFQAYLLGLHARGVLLAICSKNNEADALEVFERHPHSLLKKEHFVCIRANWKNKAENIADIAKTLQLGLSNFVFIDDSSVECALVEQSLPDLDVIQAPADPSQFERIWQAEDLFFIPHRTAEDGAKLQQYRDNGSRAESAAGFQDLSAFLQSLDTRVELVLNRPGQAEHIARIAQLTQKTNQFNLRTVRYTVQEIEAFVASEQYLVFHMQVRDKFGELGITHVCILQLDGEGGAFVDTFLMSCRVIKRELEQFFFHACAEQARAKFGVHNVRAEFVPSSKNQLAAPFWAELGLQIQREADGRQRCEASLDDLSYTQPNHIQLIAK